MAAAWEADAGPAELARIAAACDRNGFDYVAVCDHIGVPSDLAPRMGTTWYDPVATLGWLAAITERVRLLSHVFVVAYRHPLATAKSFATLDALSNGRVILGVGVGHVAAEFAALGVPFESRGQITDDYLPQIQAALAAEWGSAVLGQGPRPVQPGGPPIWVGGSSVPALRRAATIGDGWLPQGPVEGGPERAMALLREYRDRAGRTMDGFAIGGGLSCYLGRPSGPVDAWTLVGSSDEVLTRLGQVEADGVTHVQLRVPSSSCEDLIDQIDQFGAEVITTLSVSA